MTIDQALNTVQHWLDFEGVEGIGEGESEGIPCITVFVSQEDLQIKIPKEIEGFPVVVEETGSFNAL